MLTLLHVPKTGGCARQTSLMKLKDQYTYGEHHLRASDMNTLKDTVAYLRSPIDRFLSGYSMRMKHAYPTVNDAARALGSMSSTDFVFLPATHWVNRPGVQLYTLERMDHTWPILMRRYDLDAAPLPGPGEVGRHDDDLPDVNMAHLSYNAILRIEDFYAEDIQMWEDTYLAGR